MIGDPGGHAGLKRRSADARLLRSEGSNPADGMDVRSLVFVVCRVGSDLWDELITRLQEYYRVCLIVCVCVCVCL